MSLPLQSVDELFGRMAIRYGSAWLRMWEGVDISAVKAEWAHELSRCCISSILYALDHMSPERPPTVKQFRLLCAQAPTPAPTVVRIGHKPTAADKERVAKMLAEVKKKIAIGKLV